MKAFDNSLLELMRRIGKVLMEGRDWKITTRNVGCDIGLSKTQVNELTHGRNVKFVFYQKYFSLLFDSNNIDIMPDEGLQELLIAVTNCQDMIIVRLDKHTHQEVGERKYIMRNRT